MSGTPFSLIAPGWPGAIGQDTQWSPTKLFASAAAWVWYDPSDFSTLFSDLAGTVPAVVDGPVGYIRDKSPNAWHAISPSTGARPVLRQIGSIYYLECDGVDDCYALPSAAYVLFKNASLGMVATSARGSTLSANLFAISTATGSVRTRLTYEATVGVSFGGRRLDADSFSVIQVGSLDTGDYSIRGMHDWANSDSYIFKNGSQVASNLSFQTSGITSNTNSTFAFMASANGNLFWSGRIYQFLAGQPASLTANMAQLDGFLTRKRGG